MAILAKNNGWLISGEVIRESAFSWIFKAVDEKTEKIVAKNDPSKKVFEGENCVDEAMNWQRIIKKNNLKSNK